MRIEIVTGHAGRRRYGTEERLVLMRETMQAGMMVSAVARLHGISPSLLWNWRRRMSQGGQVAVKADENVVAVSRVRELEQRVRDLERPPGRKIVDIETLQVALVAARGKKPVWQLPSPLRDVSR